MEFILEVLAALAFTLLYLIFAVGLIILGVALYIGWQLLAAYVPIWRLFASNPLDWVTWREVKRASGCRTDAVLKVLQSLSRSGLLEYRLRDEKTLARLRRHCKRSVPSEPYAGTGRAVIFFEYRLRRIGTFRWPTISARLRRLLSAPGAEAPTPA